MQKELCLEAINRDSALPSGVLTVDDMYYHAYYYYFASMADYARDINKLEAEKNLKSAYDFSVDYNKDLKAVILEMAPNIASWTFD